MPIVNLTPLWFWSEVNRLSAELYLAAGKAYATAIGGGSPTDAQTQELRGRSLAVLDAIHTTEQPGREGLAAGPLELRVLRAAGALRRGDEAQARQVLGIGEGDDVSEALRAAASRVGAAWQGGAFAKPPAPEAITPYVRIKQLEGAASRAVTELIRLREQGAPVDAGIVEFVELALGPEHASLLPPAPVPTAWSAARAADICPGCNKAFAAENCGHTTHAMVAFERGDDVMVKKSA